VGAEHLKLKDMKILIAFCLLLAVVFSSACTSAPSASQTQEFVKQLKAEEEPAKQLKAEEEPAKQLKAEEPANELDDSDWSYANVKDQMGRGDSHQASVQSLNNVTFGFPYGGPQKATLTLRVDPKYGRDVIFQIEQGQFLCKLDECTVSVRFDED
jgi:hypothetical protein